LTLVLTGYEQVLDPRLVDIKNRQHEQASPGMLDINSPERGRLG
jgi:hypothetical protein